MEKIELRVILRHYWKQGFKATDAAKKICQVEGEGIVEVRTAQIWFKRFNDGDTTLKDNAHTGRPITVDSSAIVNAVEANPSTSTRRLSCELGIPTTSVFRHLKGQGKVNKCCREVPHDLTDIQFKP